MASFSDRPTGSKTARKVTPLQFVGVVLAFLLVAVLSGILAAGLFVPAVGALGAAAKSVPSVFDEIPAELELVVPSQESRMLDSEGREIARFFSARRVIKPSEEISQTMKNAIVAIEDRRFYTHHGIDPDGLARAAFNNLNSDATQGASTITQQYVKNMLMEKGLQEGDEDLIEEAQEVSLERKLREARYALALETKFTKDEILTGYLNLAPFGTNIFGVETGAQTYFNTSAAELTVSQSAMLAGIVQSPVQYDPLTNPDLAVERRDDVLYWMLKEDYISQEEHDNAVALTAEEMLKPNVRKEGCKSAGTMAYFCEYVLADFKNDETFGETVADRIHLLETGGLTIRTTVDQRLQAAAYQAAIDRIPVYDESKLDNAIISMETNSGRIVAMAQNTEFGTEGGRSTEVSYSVYRDHGGGLGFQPGSTFKAFTLVEWFNEGRSVYETVGSNNRIYPSGSFSCQGIPYGTGTFPVGDLYGKDGPTDVVRATRMSINQAFVSMATKIDYCEIFKQAAALGAVTEKGEAVSPDNPSAIIGGSTDIAPLSMAEAFAAIGNNGMRCTPMAIREVADRDGKVLRSYEPSCKEAISAKVAQQTATILKWTGRNYENTIDGGNMNGRPFGAKTGTTDENSNTWVVGFTPQFTTAAWVGHANNSSLPVNDIRINGVDYDQILGGDFVLPMWAQYMREAHQDMDYLEIPDVWVGNRPLPTPSPTPSTAAPTTPPAPNPAPAPPAPNPVAPPTSGIGDGNG